MSITLMAEKYKLGKTSVKISYAQLDIIIIQFNFTTIAYAWSLKETQSQDRHKFILGNP